MLNGIRKLSVKVDKDQAIPKIANSILATQPAIEVLDVDFRKYTDLPRESRDSEFDPHPDELAAKLFPHLLPRVDEYRRHHIKFLTLRGVHLKYAKYGLLQVLHPESLEFLKLDDCRYSGTLLEVLEEGPMEISTT